MATPLEKLHTFPLKYDLSEIPNGDSNICVVTIFGKGRFNPFCSKATPLNPVLDRDIFKGTIGNLGEQFVEGNVECFFDSDSKVIYLHIVSHYDTNMLAEKCQLLEQKQDSQDFYSVCEEEDLKHAKNLLLLFSISHIVLLCHPGSAFDLSYLKLFHTLDSLRLKLQPSISEVLSGIQGVSQEWAEFGRVATPRMLFLFETSAVDVQPDEAEAGMTKPSKKYPPMRKLQICLEDMVFRILRRTRAITNISNNSLFSVPINQQYVYIHSKRSEISDPVDFFMAQLKHKCFPFTDDSALTAQKPKAYSTSRRKANPSMPDSLPLSAPSTLPLTTHTMSSSTLSSKLLFLSSSSSIPRGQEQCLKEFLWQHIEMVFSKTINDNLGRHGIEPISQLPTFDTWLRVANSMHDFFFSSHHESRTSQHLSNLRSLLDVSMRFSENRCNKVLPLAESAYQQDLPAFYVTTYHLNKLHKAKRLFAQHARGPAYSRYLAELEAACERFWRSGHQQCEALSLTGNLCNSKVHRLPTEESQGPDDTRTVSEHTSQLKTKAACNCGRLQADKDDPFNHKSANYDFYQVLAVNCCSRLEQIYFPAFVSSTPDAKAAVFPSRTTAATTVTTGPSVPQQRQQQIAPDTGIKDGDKPESFSTLSELSLALSLGQTSAAVAELDPKISQVEEEKPEREIQEGEMSHPVDVDLETSKRHPTVRQPSTTEYLPYMIHSKSPPGLLPKFSSYSLCRLGTAGYYSHISGLDLPGFLPGSNFLLPWDIPVKSEQEKWPTVSETFAGAKKRQQRKLSKPTAEAGDTMTTIRVYLGMEYECPRGHRFFCSGPDKVIKVSSNSMVKDNAGRLVHMDMPLYTLCHCKQPKGCMSQMMRIFVVTPRDTPNCPSIRVLINPLIQPSLSPCPQFHPGLDEPQELPADGMWVFRLPHIYRDEQQVYLMPTDHQQLHGCFLSKGMFTYKLL